MLFRSEVWWFNGRVKTRIIGEARIKTDKIDSEALAYMLKSEMLPKIYIQTKISMENKILLRSRISLVVLRTSIKNKVHAIHWCAPGAKGKCALLLLLKTIR